MQGSGKDLIQPVLDNQLKAASPLLVPPQVRPPCSCRIPASTCLMCNLHLVGTVDAGAPHCVSQVS